MTDQSSSRMNEATTIHVTVITVVILQHGNSAPGIDAAAPIDEGRAEPRTRQQHAASDSADTTATDG